MKSRAHWIGILLIYAACGDDGTQVPPCDDGTCTGTTSGGSTSGEATTRPQTGSGSGSGTDSAETGSSSSGDPGSTTVDTTGSTTADTTGSSTTGGSDSSSGESGSSSTGSATTCGNGALEADEECDDGDSEDGNGCDNDCTASIVVGLSAGSDHTCATLDTGVVRCWGLNFSGVLGLGNTTAVGDNEPPSDSDAASLGIGIATVSSGYLFNCARTVEDTVRCWGRNDRGQLAYGNLFDIGDDELPSSAGNSTLAKGTVATVTTGSSYACAAYDDGEVACWGANDFGQLGYGNYDYIGDDEPVSAAGFVDVPGDVVELALGERHTCALLDTGAVRCWGYGLEGALGYGNTAWIGDDELPSSVGEVNVPPATSIVARSNHTCILTDEGTVWCWGRASAGLGYNTTMPIGDDEEPLAALHVGETMANLTVTQIVTGANHMCALLSDSTVVCWGAGADGQLGYGDTEDIGDDEGPQSAGTVDVGGPVQLLAAGDRHTCALLESGGVRCWGWGWGGRLGYGNIDNIGDDETPSSAGDVPLFPTPE